MATVRKRSWVSGGETKTKWICDYTDQTSKRHLKTFDKKKDADSWLVQTRHEVSRGVHTTSNTALAAAAELWIERARANGRERGTQEQYERHVRLHILPLLGSNTKLSQLSPPVIEKFRDELLKQCSWVMARKVLTSLKSLLADAQRRGLVGTNAAATVKVDGHKRQRHKLAVGSGLPSKLEINRILAAADETRGIGRPLLVTAIFTGLRASELRGLRWRDVDFTSKTVHIRQRADAWNKIGRPKSAAGDRTVPMSPMVVNALREWKLASGSAELVFPTSTGRPQSHANLLQRVVAPIQRKAGIAKPYGLHAFRHFFASWAIEQGFGPKKLQELLGHSSIAMVYDVYGHLFPSLEDDHAKFAAGEFALMK